MLKLLYFEAIISSKAEVPQKKPTICAWNVGLLRKTEAMEIKAGGFGMLPVKPEYMIPKMKEERKPMDKPRTPPRELGKKAIENSKLKKDSPITDPPSFDVGNSSMSVDKGKKEDDFPKFDLGISPMKDTTLTPMSNAHQVDSSKGQYKGKQVVYGVTEQMKETQRR
ncbi:hypothetical protein L6452_19558 [Arctium lappa]|uniref:Uncharacterized protein n=1 Tax=Arctium lappa TaxID=4217 RepID=A0ACB9B852_ARCLA|nr:hypothetical protein L6452_19558 [Arctium lappa]